MEWRSNKVRRPTPGALAFLWEGQVYLDSRGCRCVALAAAVSSWFSLQLSLYFVDPRPHSFPVCMFIRGTHFATVKLSFSLAALISTVPTELYAVSGIAPRLQNSLVTSETFPPKDSLLYDSTNTRNSLDSAFSVSFRLSLPGGMRTWCASFFVRHCESLVDVTWEMKNWTKFKPLRNSGPNKKLNKNKKHAMKFCYGFCDRSHAQFPADRSFFILFYPHPRFFTLTFFTASHCTLYHSVYMSINIYLW